MHRLSQGQHHVIGDVNQSTDRTMSRTLQALHHPQRCRRIRVEIFNHTPRQTTARHRGINFNWQSDVCIRRNRFDHQRRERHRICPTHQCAHIARHTAHRQAVRAVRCEFNRINCVIQTQILAQVLTDWRRIFSTRWQLVQTRSIGIDAQLFGRTQHPR